MVLLDILLDQYFTFSIKIATCFFFAFLGACQTPNALTAPELLFNSIERMVPGLFVTDTEGSFVLLLYLRWPPNQSKSTIYQKIFSSIKVLPTALSNPDQAREASCRFSWIYCKDLPYTGRYVSPQNTRAANHFFIVDMGAFRRME